MLVLRTELWIGGCCCAGTYHCDQYGSVSGYSMYA